MSISLPQVKSNLDTRTGSKQQDLCVTETKTDPVFQKQLSYLKKHGEEIQTFLNHVIKETNELGDPSETVQKAQAIANKTLPILEKLDTTNPKAVDEALELCLEAHLSCIEAESPTRKAKLVSPSFLKRVEKLDRLLRNRTMSVFTALNLMTASLCLPLQDLCTDSTNSGTANSSYFVREKLGEAQQMVFKPRESERRLFSCVETKGGFRRQIAAYLVDRRNGGAADVPLSVLGQNKEGIGSLQTFRKNQDDLTKLNNEQSKQISLPNFQQVALHRLRFYDLDAHLGNFLKKESQGKTKLIPIDFDYTLPRIQDHSDAKHINLKIGIRFFPHMDQPLEAEVKRQLLSINLEDDVKILEDLQFGKEEIKLFKHTTTMLQEMAKKDFTLGQMLDELDSTSFRSQVVETSDEENLQEVCKTSVETAFSFNEELNAKILEVRQELAKGDAKAAEKGKDFIQILFEDHSSHRAILVIMKDLLEKFPDEQETTLALEYLQGKSHSNMILMYDVFRGIAQQMKALGLHDKAEALEKWMTDVLF